MRKFNSCDKSYQNNCYKRELFFLLAASLLDFVAKKLSSLSQVQHIIAGTSLGDSQIIQGSPRIIYIGVSVFACFTQNSRPLVDYSWYPEIHQQKI